MNCKATERLIPLFLTDQLTNKDLASFLSHVDDCEECKEELTIQYLVMIGASLLEEGKSFDLRQALDSLIEDYLKRVRRWRALFLLSYVVEVLTILIVIIILMMVIFL